MAREYEVKLRRTTVEETILTVEAQSQMQAACQAGLRAGTDNGWQPKSVTVEVADAAWKQGGE